MPNTLCTNFEIGNNKRQAVNIQIHSLRDVLSLVDVQFGATFMMIMTAKKYMQLLFLATKSAVQKNTASYIQFTASTFHLGATMRCREELEII
jgi:hypothetical protein